MRITQNCALKKSLNTLVGPGVVFRLERIPPNRVLGNFTGLVYELTDIVVLVLLHPALTT